MPIITTTTSSNASSTEAVPAISGSCLTSVSFPREIGGEWHTPDTRHREAVHKVCSSRPEDLRTLIPSLIAEGLFPNVIGLRHDTTTNIGRNTPERFDDCQQFSFELGNTPQVRGIQQQTLASVTFVAFRERDRILGSFPYCLVLLQARLKDLLKREPGHALRRRFSGLILLARRKYQQTETEFEATKSDATARDKYDALLQKNSKFVITTLNCLTRYHEGSTEGGKSSPCKNLSKHAFLRKVGNTVENFVLGNTPDRKSPRYLLKAKPLLSIEDCKKKLDQAQFAITHQIVYADVKVLDICSILVCSLARLAVKIALQMKSGSSLEPTDRIQLGIQGIYRALNTFDPRKGWALSTYAFNWIRQSIRGAIGAELLLKSPIKIANGETTRAAPITISLDRAVDEDGTSSLVDLMASPGPDVPTQAMNAEIVESIRIVFDRMKKTSDRSRRQAEVLEHRLGIGTAPKSLREIGQLMSLTLERIRQIEQQGIEYLANQPEIKRQNTI